MVQNLFQVISDTITAFIGALSSGISSVSQIVYDTSGTTPQVTFVGTLLLMAIGFGVVYWIFRLIRGLTAGLNR